MKKKKNIVLILCLFILFVVLYAPFPAPRISIVRNKEANTNTCIISHLSFIISKIRFQEYTYTI